MKRLTLQVLGPFRAHLGPDTPLSLTARKAQALLAYLGCHLGQPQPRDKLTSLLWPESGEAHARQSFRVALVALRQALSLTARQIIMAEGETITLAASAVEVDAIEFARLIAKGTPRALADAASLYKGDFLDGFRVTEGPFEEWLRAERMRLRELAAETFAKLLRHHEAQDSIDAAIQTAIRLLSLDPLQEAVHRQLMSLYVRQGRRGAALRQYQACVTALQQDLGAEPEPETRRLYQTILRQPGTRANATNVRDVQARASSNPRGVDLPAADTPLFGREDELAQLKGLLEQAIKRGGRTAVVLGEAGIGKTRLLSALVTVALERGCRLLFGRCHESDSILPFGPWVDAYRSGGLSADDDIVSRLHPASRAELSRVLPEVDAPGLPRPSDNDLRLFDGVAQLAAQAAARRPIVLMLEDLHGADEMSLRLLAFVARRVREWAVLVVATARDDELVDADVARRILGELSQRHQATQIRLSALSRAQTTCLVRALVHSDAAPTAGGLEEQVWTVSEGNPLVVVETTRALRDRTLRHDVGTLPLTERIRDLIANRLERLSDRARELASVAAVIGRSFHFALLHRAGGLDERATAEGVEELVRRSVLRGLGERFEFSHDRVRAVAYDKLLPFQRKARHRRVGEALEALSPTDRERDDLVLGIHFREGELWDKAVRYLRRAGLKAMARSAYREAGRAYEYALAVLARLPETPATAADGIDLRIGISTALHAQAEYDRALDMLRPAEPIASALNDTMRLGQVLARMCLFLRMLGDYRGAIAVGQRALAIADDLANPALQCWCRLWLSHAYYAVGDSTGAAKLLRDVVESTSCGWAGSSSRPPELHCLTRVDGPRGEGSRERLTALAHTWLAVVLAELGRFDEAEREGEEGLHSAEAANDPWPLVCAFAGLAQVNVARGNFHRAIDLAERGDALAQTWSISDWTWALNGTLSSAYSLTARLSEARIHAEQAVATTPVASRAVRIVGSLPPDAYLLAGPSAGAFERAKLALDVSHEQSDDRGQAWAHRLLAEIALQSDPPALTDAEAHYRLAVVSASQHGLRPFVAHCHAGLGKLYRRTGKPEQAEEYLTSATTMYREMGMTYWLEKAEAELTA